MARIIYCYNQCGQQIKFDDRHVSASGKKIPLNLNGEPHDCPNRPQQRGGGAAAGQQLRQQQFAPTAATGGGPQEKTISYITSEASSSSTTVRMLEEQIAKLAQQQDQMQMQLDSILYKVRALEEKNLDRDLGRIPRHDAGKDVESEMGFSQP